jgi:hypothetical protein
MPTHRRRHQITETPEIADAINQAARRWPGEPRSRLLIRLVREGARSLEPDLQRDRREQAITATSGKYAEAFDDRYLETLREDWPA